MSIILIAERTTRLKINYRFRDVARAQKVNAKLQELKSLL